MVWLSIIWFVFASMFLILGCYHRKMVGKSISYLQVSDNQFGQAGMKAQVHIVGVDFKDFVDKFNQYINYYNQTSSKEHKAQSIGYFVASATAIFSFALTFVS